MANIQTSRRPERHAANGRRPAVTLAAMPPQPVTDRPITEELPALMRTHALSYRAVAATTQQIDPSGRGLTHGHIANLASGHERPSRRALELLAAAFELQPCYFAEHRLAQLREQLDERRVGFDAAYRRYRTLTHAA
jgi:transcriptional regulator with XRE-family HTH domain